MTNKFYFLGLTFLLVNCSKVDQRYLLQKWKVEKIESRESASANAAATSKNREVVKQFEQEGFLDFTGGLTYKARFFDIDFKGGMGADLNAALNDHKGTFDVSKRMKDTLQLKLRLPNAPDAASNNAEASLYVYELQKNRMVTGFSIGKRQGTEEFLEVTWKPY